MNGTDVGNKEQVSKALQEVYRQCGRIDYIINTAGLLNKEPLMSCDYQTICNAVNTNYMGTVNVALEAFPYLKESKGKLVFFTSSSYTRGRGLLQHLFIDQSRHRELCASHSTRMGTVRHQRELHQSGTYQDTDACP